MPQMLRTDGSTAARGVDGEFLELLCADDDLLRAEFDAIIAAQWPGPQRKAPTTAPPSTHARRGPDDGQGPALRTR